MKKNVGTLDMVIRLAIGALLVLLGLVDNPVIRDQTARKVVMAAALIPILTGLVRYCPLYTLIGFSSCKRQ